MTSRFILPFSDVGSGIIPSNGAKLFFFESDGTTPKDTHTTKTADIANTNPVIANSVGVFPSIYITGDYLVTLKDNNDVQIFGLAPVNEFSVATDNAFIKNFKTLTLAIADNNLLDGDTVIVEERTDGNGGGSEWNIVLLSTVTVSIGAPDIGNIVAWDDNTGASTDLALSLNIKPNFSIKQFGAKHLSGTFNSLVAIEQGLLFAATNKIDCDWSGDFRINGQLVLDSTFSGLTTIGKMKLRLFGTFATNISAFHVPTSGDNFGGTSAGADDMRISHVEGDCASASASTAFTAGVTVYGGNRNVFDTLEGHDVLKMGVSVGSVLGTPVSMNIGTVIGFNADDGIQAAGQGFASALDNDDDNVSIGNIFTFDNAIFGIDFSTGPINVDYIYTTRNGQPASGGAGKFAGTGSNRTNIGTWVSLDDESGPLTNGTQKYVSIDQMVVIDCLGQGFQIANDGVYRIGHYYSENATNNGLQITSGDVTVDTLQGDGNGTNLCAITGGSLHVGYLNSKNHADGAGLVASTTGFVVVLKSKSEEDKDGCLRFVGVSTQYSSGDVEINHTTLTAPGVFVNASPTGVKVGKITKAGTAVEIDDSANNSVTRERTIFNKLVTIDPGVLASGAIFVSLQTVTGAELGDFVDVAFAKDYQQVNIFGYVNSTNTVEVIFHNTSTSSRTLTVATTRIKVESVN